MKIHTCIAILTLQNNFTTHTYNTHLVPTVRTTLININRININPNDYYNPVMDYYNPVIDYYNPVIDYYNLLLRF